MATNAAADAGGLTVRSGHASEQGIRPTMEDEVSIKDRFYIPGRGHFSFYGVFDGHGGRAAAIFTRDHLFLQLHAALSAGLDPAAALTQAYLEVDAAFIAACRGQEEKAERDRAAHAAALAAAHPVLTLPSSDSMLPQRRQQSANLMISVPSASLPASKGSVATAARSSSEVTSAQQPPLEKDTSGTTAVSVLLHHESWTLWCANAGDSRAVLSTSNGAIVTLTNDHKADRVDEADRIRRAGGFVVHKRVMGELAISRAIGDLDFKEDGFHFVLPHPEIAVQVLTGRDEFILLACDGIFDVLSNELACAYVRKELAKTSPTTFAPLMSLNDVSMSIVRHAIDALNTRDNVTVVLVKLPPRSELQAANLDRADVPALEPNSVNAGQLYDSHVMSPPPLPGSVTSPGNNANGLANGNSLPTPTPSTPATATPVPAASSSSSSSSSAAVAAATAHSTPAFTHVAPIAVTALPPAAASSSLQQPGRVLAPHRASSASLSQQSSVGGGLGGDDGDGGIQFHDEELPDQDEQTMQEEAHMRRTMQR